MIINPFALFETTTIVSLTDCEERANKLLHIIINHLILEMLN